MTHTEATLASPASATTPPSRTSHFHRIWPATFILLGLALTVAWVALLGYGLVSLIALAL